ncbi:MAG: hypothetical protein NTW53_01895 [Burkholderiales bacterium]|nr:hypothetical protein [Burkholderiales bacterium]
MLKKMDFDNKVSRTAFTAHVAAACLLAFGGTVYTTTIVGGSIENQAVLRRVSHASHKNHD